MPYDAIFEKVNFHISQNRGCGKVAKHFCVKFCKISIRLIPNQLSTSSTPSSNFWLKNIDVMARIKATGNNPSENYGLKFEQ